MFRFLMRYLVNNQRVIERMANSYVMRRAAQMTVYMFHRSKAALEDKGAMDLKDKVSKQVKDLINEAKPGEKVKNFKDRFSRELKKEWEKAQGEEKPPKRN